MSTASPTATTASPASPQAATTAKRGKPKEEPVLKEGHPTHGEVFNEGPRRAAYLMNGVGVVRFPVTTTNEEACKFA
ncbi:MAG: hypothetical protein U0936_12390 [Planctomycetaceae bacterium]